MSLKFKQTKVPAGLTLYIQEVFLDLQERRIFQDLLERQNDSSLPNAERVQIDLLQEYRESSEELFYDGCSDV
jgi:hypothetical protein